MSFWATIISTVQMSIFERGELIALGNTEDIWKVMGWLACFVVSLFFLYSLMPIAFQLSSAVFVNLGLLTGNFTSLVIF